MYVARISCYIQRSLLSTVSFNRGGQPVLNFFMSLLTDSLRSSSVGSLNTCCNSELATSCTVHFMQCSCTYHSTNKWVVSLKLGAHLVSVLWLHCLSTKYISWSLCSLPSSAEWASWTLTPRSHHQTYRFLKHFLQWWKLKLIYTWCHGSHT